MSTDTFDYTGAVQQFVVPDGTTSVTAECWGASGGLFSFAHGAGGYAKGTYTVTPGETLYIYVGGEGRGDGAPGWNGGGNSGTGGGSGGGASDVRRGGTALANRIIVAGGGGGVGVGGSGGGGSQFGGHGGGLEGEDGQGASGTNSGRGGTQTTGSALGQGRDAFYYSGGGGGGYWGGWSGANTSGASYYYGGGGGGSGYVGTGTDAELATGGHGGPGQVKLTYNVAPNAPTQTSPVNGAVVSRLDPIPLRADFSDPDPGDSPSASRWYYRPVGASTWTTVLQANPLQNYSIPAGIAADDYEWQVEYADQSGAWGARSNSEFFTAIDPPPGPVWLDPLNGQAITTNSYTGVISTASLEESEWTLYADDGAGNIDTGTIIQGPVTVNTGDLRRHTFTGLVNNVPLWWSVRTKDAGLYSQHVQIRTPVTYAPPPPLGLTLQADNATASLLIVITNPPPAAGEPDAVYNDVEVNDGAGWFRVATLLPPNLPYRYMGPRARRDYSGNVRVTTVGSNGTKTTTIAV